MDSADILDAVLDGSHAGPAPSSVRALAVTANDVARALASARLSRADQDRIYARSLAMLETATDPRGRRWRIRLPVRRPAPVMVGGVAALALGGAAVGWALLHGRRAGHPAAA